MSGFKFGRRKSRDALKSRSTFTNMLKKVNFSASAAVSIISWFWFLSTILRHKLCLLGKVDTQTMVPKQKEWFLKSRQKTWNQRECFWVCYGDWLDLAYLYDSSRTHIWWTNNNFFHYISIQTNYWFPLHRSR